MFISVKVQGFSEVIVKQDTGRYHPTVICVYNLGRNVRHSLEFKLPYEKDQSGMANILFKNKNSGEICHLDRFSLLSSPDNPNYYRSYRIVFFSGRYDVIFLYNNGKYIKYPDVLFENNMSIDVDLENFPVQPPDSESRDWLTMRKFTTSVFSEKPTVVSDSKSNVIGYVFNDVYGISPSCAWSGIIKAGDNFTYTTDKIEGFFEFCFDSDTTIKFLGDFTIEKSIEINAKENSWIIVMMEEDRAAVWEKAIISIGIKK